MGGHFLRPEWQDNMDTMQWLELFDPFIAVQSLHVSEELEPVVAPVLQELTGRRSADVLPALRTIVLEGQYRSVREVIETFIAPGGPRQLSDHPAVVQRWYRKRSLFRYHLNVSVLTVLGLLFMRIFPFLVILVMTNMPTRGITLLQAFKLTLRTSRLFLSL